MLRFLDLIGRAAAGVAGGRLAWASSGTGPAVRAAAVWDVVMPQPQTRFGGGKPDGEDEGGAPTWADGARCF